jgi:beta-xylosidase
MSYRNPILPGFNPDPSMIYHNGHYYLVTSSFEFFPGIPVYRSENLIDWTLIGHVLSRRSQLDLRQCEPGGGIFAPCLRWNQFNQRFYVAVCALHRMKSAVSGDVSIYRSLGRLKLSARLSMGLSHGASTSPPMTSKQTTGRTRCTAMRWALTRTCVFMCCVGGCR